jgi:hypothetical protein
LKQDPSGPHMTRQRSPLSLALVPDCVAYKKPAPLHIAGSLSSLANRFLNIQCTRPNRSALGRLNLHLCIAHR